MSRLKALPGSVTGSVEVTSLLTEVVLSSSLKRKTNVNVDSNGFMIAQQLLKFNRRPNYRITFFFSFMLSTRTSTLHHSLDSTYIGKLFSPCPILNEIFIPHTYLVTKDQIFLTAHSNRTTFDLVITNLPDIPLIVQHHACPHILHIFLKWKDC